jgi:hypothetical protein
VSRFVEVDLALGTLDEITHALAVLGIAFERTGEPLLLEGGIECGDVPVDLRIAAGTCGSVEALGFVAGKDGVAVLVCGEPDRRRLERELITPLVAEVSRARLSVDPTLEVETVAATDGTIRVRVRSR